MPSVYLDKKNNQTKAISVASCVIDVKNLTKSFNGVKKDGEIDVGEIISLCKLPTNILIIRSDVVVHQGTTGGGHIKVEVDSTEVFADAAVGNTPTALATTTASVYKPTGGEVKATFGTAKLTDGIIEVVLTYIELDRTTGNYLN